QNVQVPEKDKPLSRRKQALQGLPRLERLRIRRDCKDWALESGLDSGPDAEPEERVQGSVEDYDRGAGGRRYDFENDLAGCDPSGLMVQANKASLVF
ncbi:unnamed protein product, partial [Rhizoctonia solani]